MSRKPGRSTVVLIATDRCIVLDGRKAPEHRVEGSGLVITPESIRLGDEVVFYAIPPVGLGDAHWERAGDGPVAFRRYTHIEVLA